MTARADDSCAFYAQLEGSDEQAAPSLDAVALLRLRDALDAIPRPYGAWGRSGALIHVEESEEWPHVQIQVSANKTVRPKVLRYLTACNPAAIRALLELVDAPTVREQEAPSDARAESFAEWLAREMPAGTVISDPLWWAPRIVRVLSRQPAQPKEAPAFPSWMATRESFAERVRLAGWKEGDSGDGLSKVWTALSAALTTAAPATSPPAFQQRVQPWMMACFGPAISADVVERNHRFLEESLELVQSTGCTQSEAHQLVEYVYGRPAGETAQEVGGVMVTLAALCLAHSGLDMHAAGETELARIWTCVEKIRAKQAAKPAHSPLPAAPATPPGDGSGARTLHSEAIQKEYNVCADCPSPLGRGCECPRKRARG